MNWKRNTYIFIVATIFAVAVYDVTTIHFGGIETSISQTLIELFYTYPILGICTGIVIGHLGWRLRDNKDTNNLGK